MGTPELLGAPLVVDVPTSRPPDLPTSRPPHFGSSSLTTPSGNFIGSFVNGFTIST
jgi:hypothetical protein